MRFLFRGDRRREDLDHLNGRIRDLQAEIRRIEQSMEPQAEGEDSAETYRSVQRLRELMLRDDLRVKSAELEQMTTRAAELESRLSRGRRPPEHPSVREDTYQSPESPAAVPPPERPVITAPPAPQAPPITPARAGQPEEHGPAPAPSVPAPMERAGERAGTKAALSRGHEARVVQTAAGWRGARWVFVVLTFGAMGAWIAGALYFSGIMEPALQGGLQSRPGTGIGSAAQVAVASPPPAMSVAPVVAVAPTSVPTAVPPARPTTVPIAPPPPGSPTVDAGTPAPAGDRSLGNAMVFAPSGFTGALLRPEPNLRSQSQRFLSNGTVVQVLDGANVADDFTWIRVRTEDGTIGWIVSLTIAR